MKLKWPGKAVKNGNMKWKISQVQTFTLIFLKSLYFDHLYCHQFHGNPHLFSGGPPRWILTGHSACCAHLAEMLTAPAGHVFLLVNSLRWPRVEDVPTPCHGVEGLAQVPTYF